MLPPHRWSVVVGSGSGRNIQVRLRFVEMMQNRRDHEGSISVIRQRLEVVDRNAHLLYSYKLETIGNQRKPLTSTAQTVASEQCSQLDSKERPRFGVTRPCTIRFAAFRENP